MGDVVIVKPEPLPIWLLDISSVMPRCRRPAMMTHCGDKFIPCPALPTLLTVICKKGVLNPAFQPYVLGSCPIEANFHAMHERGYQAEAARETLICVT